MPAQFFDRQHRDNPLNGNVIPDAGAVEALVHELRTREPFLAELIADTGGTLLLGLGSGDGCVQFSSAKEKPPSLVPLRNPPVPAGEQEFLIRSTPTPVPRRFCLPMRKVARIAAAFLRTGERASDVEWEAI